LSWKDTNGKPAVIHRLAVHPQHQKLGYAKQLMNFAENLATEQGYTSIRLDSYTGNPRAIRFYENREYVKRGEVYFPGRVLVFYCFEKELKSR
jgi:ribosomal protein S18 acetylase RimI-like enzyme